MHQVSASENWHSLGIVIIIFLAYKNGYSDYGQRSIWLQEPVFPDFYHFYKKKQTQTQTQTDQLVDKQTLFCIDFVLVLSVKSENNQVKD